MANRKKIKSSIIIPDNSMKLTKKQPLVKLRNTGDVRRFMVQNIELDAIQAQEHFFIIYLNSDIEVIGLKTICKEDINSDADIIRQILSADLDLNINGFIVCHNYQSNTLVVSEDDIEFANKLINAAFFSCMYFYDYQVLNSYGYLSMHDTSIVNFDKHRYFRQRTIKQNERFTIMTPTQELFDMGGQDLYEWVITEYYKIDCLNSFVFFELFPEDQEKLRSIEFDAVRADTLKQPLTKMFLVSLFKEYMIIKERLMKFVNESNLYGRYLSYLYDFNQYNVANDAEKARKKDEKAKKQRCFILPIKSENHLQIVR